MERLSEGRGFGDGNLRPSFDPKLHRDVVAETIRGRKIGDYRQALEAHGFRFYPPERLPRWNNGQQRTEGEWRSERTRLALTEQEVLMHETPQKFWEWVEKVKLQRRAARSRIYLP